MVVDFFVAKCASFYNDASKIGFDRRVTYQRIGYIMDFNAIANNSTSMIIRSYWLYNHFALPVIDPLDLIEGTIVRSQKYGIYVIISNQGTSVHTLK
ncbi:hypothetical protein D3C73_1341720 [compost metagenome]